MREAQSDVFTFFAFVRGPVGRSGGRILENVALCFPGTGTYAHSDNVVKSSRQLGTSVRSHGNSPISALLRMVALSRLERRRSGLQIDLDPG